MRLDLIHPYWARQYMDEGYKMYPASPEDLTKFPVKEVQNLQKEMEVLVEQYGDRAPIIYVIA